MILERHPVAIPRPPVLDERPELVAFLHGLGIAIRPGSVFEDICRCLDDLHRDDLGPRMQHVVAMVDLVRKLQRTRNHPSFETLVPHLRLLEEVVLDPSRNAKAAVREQASNRLFELLVATAAMTFSPAVVLATDVIVEVDGIPWGFACKTLHTRDRRAYRARVAEGIRQIERAPVRAGLVVLNLKGLIDPEGLVPYEPILETDREIDRHLALARTSIRSKIEEVGDLVADSFSRTKLRPHVVHYLPGRAFAQAWALEFTGAALPPEVARVLDALNRGLQFG